MKITRKDYMKGKATHDEYYAQFVTPYIKKVVVASVGVKAIKSSIDPHFNDIGLIVWDRLAPFIRQSIGYTSALSDCVCVAKQAAKQFKQELK